MNHEPQSILDALLVGVIALDGSNTIDSINSEAVRILELSGQNLRGHDLVVQLGDDHPLCVLVERVHKSGRAAIHDDLEFPRRGTAPLPVDVAASPIREPAANAGIAISIRDRSAARSLHEEIRERERQESYGHIAAGIAHEVKNPLGGIRGAAELLGLAASDDRGRRTADLIVGEVDRISDLVDEMMIFARGDHLTQESVNIHRLLDALLDLLEFERFHEDIEIVRVFDPSLPEIQADPARLQQVFMNLAKNALQAMEEDGGQLTLSTRMLIDQRLVAPNGRPTPTIEVGFSDTGIGIPPDIQDRLSTPFFTTKKKGTGLGLSLTRHWIGRHGGRLRLESEQAVGTKAFVDLPIQSLAAPQQTGTNSQTAAVPPRSCGA